MSYKAEKDKIERKIRIIKIVLLCILLAVLVGLCIFSAFCPPNTWKYYVGKPKIEKRREGELRMHFLDVGQGESILIELPDGKVALIDGGDWLEDTATTILRYMNALDIDEIDFLVASHADADHVGGLAKIVECKKVFNAYLPAVDAVKAGGSYASFYAALIEENCVKWQSSREISLSGDGYVFEFLYPYSTDTNENIETDNNGLSSVIWLDYMGISALFTGDAPTETENILMRDDRLGMFAHRNVDLKSTEILKVAHHGGKGSTSLAFLNYLQIETAVISCAENNPYEHPAQEVQDNLAAANAELYRTDKHGSIMITVSADGGYEVSCIK